MASPACERAIEDAGKYGKALLKFISPNDVGRTGGHQCGYYLPKHVWQAFTPNPPEKGRNSDHPVTVLWPDGRKTSSKVKWYGQRTRSEYRLTGFGRDFPWRTPDNVGDLLVLIPKSRDEFIAHVLDTDDDISELQAALGIEVLQSWQLYQEGQTAAETEDACLNKAFRAFAEAVEQFPEVRIFSEATRKAILGCVAGFKDLSADEQLVRLIDEEYKLYKMVERKVYQSDVTRLFRDIDEFLKTALSILQARKSRAGRSLENHVEYLLRQAGIPHQMRQVVDGTCPDILIPGKAEYEDRSYPDAKLFMVGLKMTCKDRWRQVLKEAPRIPRKHILTLQKGISGRQLGEMRDAQVTLIVPESLHRDYRDNRGEILSVHAFIDSLRETYAP